MSKETVETQTAVEALAQLGAETLARIGEYVEATENFAVEQAPLLVQEIIQYAVTINSVAAVISGLFVVAGVWLVRKALVLDEGNTYSSDRAVVYNVVGIITGSVALLFTVISVVSLIKPLMAPRLFLLDYFRALAG